MHPTDTNQSCRSCIQKHCIQPPNRTYTTFLNRVCVNPTHTHTFRLWSVTIFMTNLILKFANHYQSEKLYSQENPNSIFTLLAHQLGGWKAAWNLPRLQVVVWQLQEESECKNCLLENSWFSSSTWMLFGKLWRREKEALPRNGLELVH
jgi:hypothetical protein